MCIWMESRNELYGVTKNPYNISRYLIWNNIII
jgi:hypothetical protein